MIVKAFQRVSRLSATFLEFVRSFQVISETFREDLRSILDIQEASGIFHGRFGRVSQEFRSAPMSIIRFGGFTDNSGSFRAISRALQDVSRVFRNVSAILFGLRFVSGYFRWYKGPSGSFQRFHGRLR